MLTAKFVMALQSKPESCVVAALKTRYFSLMFSRPVFAINRFENQVLHQCFRDPRSGAVTFETQDLDEKESKRHKPKASVEISGDGCLLKPKLEALC